MIVIFFRSLGPVLIHAIEKRNNVNNIQVDNTAINDNYVCQTNKVFERLLARD